MANLRSTSVVTMSRIQALPEVLANQIAAGEVIERPASVVKELLENSLDAGAADIRVVVEGGGVLAVQVSDDGAGIHGDDLALALTRHATSKIRELRDLEQVVSMGFRGEALPSIASVSRLELTSRTANMSTASRIEVIGGVSHGQVAPAPHPVGTTVSMRDLFFNTPVRRRFLRTEKTEFRHLEDAVRAIALSRFDVAFRLRHNGRDLWSVRPAHSPEDSLSRLERLCGRAFVDAAVALEAQAGELRLRGWIGAPGAARRQADQQFFFVNGRGVRDQIVRHAIRQAFDDGLEVGMQPVFVLYLDIEPNSVDVNVHPTKHEVRFRETRMVHDFIYQCVRRALGGEPASAQGALSMNKVATPSPAHGGVSPLQASRSNQTGNDQLAGFRFLYGTPPAATAEQRPHYGSVAERLRTGSSGSGPTLIGNRYALICEPPAPRLVDMSVATLVILQRRLGDALADGALAQRPLLIPQTMAVDELKIRAIEANTPLLAHIGFDTRVIGATTASLRQVPLLLADFSPENLLESLLDLLLKLPGAVSGDDYQAAAVQAFDLLLVRLTEPQRLPLDARHAEFVQGLLACCDDQIASTVVNGRPVSVLLDETTLKKLFARS